MVVHRLPCSVHYLVLLLLLLLLFFCRHVASAAAAAAAVAIAAAVAVVVVGALGLGCFFRRGGLGDGPEENHRFPKNKQKTTASTSQ